MEVEVRFQDNRSLGSFAKKISITYRAAATWANLVAVERNVRVWLWFGPRRREDNFRVDCLFQGFRLDPRCWGVRTRSLSYGILYGKLGSWGWGIWGLWQNGTARCTPPEISGQGKPLTRREPGNRCPHVRRPHSRYRSKSLIGNAI